MISNPGLVDGLLHSLNLVDADWCFMHGEARLKSGDLNSDLDLVVAKPPLTIIARLRRAAAPLDLQPVLVWKYDPWSWTTFWMTSDAEVVQLDLTADSLGKNKYGVRTDRMLEAREKGCVWPTAAALDESLYLLSKRLFKGQLDEALRLADSLVAHPERLSRTYQLFSEPTGSRVRNFLITRTYSKARRRGPGNISRAVDRLRRPSGIWLSAQLRATNGSFVAPSEDVLSSALAPIQAELSRVWILPSTGLPTTIQGVYRRLRPGLYVSMDSSPLADGVFTISSVDSPPTAEIVKLMATVTARRFRLGKDL